jgi:hypothetical protein
MTVCQNGNFLPQEHNPMDIFKTHARIVNDYSTFIRSFLKISDDAIRAKVEEELEKGKLWPQPLLQFNPSFEMFGRVEDLSSKGALNLHPDIRDIFKGYQLYRHQVEAIQLGTEGKDFVVTSGTGSGKSLTYIGTIFNYALRNGKEFEAMTLLRTHCPQLAKEALPKASLASLLASLRVHSLKLVELMAPESNTTTLELLTFIREKQLTTLDVRILAYLDDVSPPPTENEEEDDDGESSRELAAMDAFLKCRSAQFWGYREYIDEQSPFSTQQGVKGSEFNRVLVVLDDEESRHFQFSYEKYFGVRALSDSDLENQQAGKETVIDRTRRLFYVCCTRAMTDLAVVFFCNDLAAAEEKVRASGLFMQNSVHTAIDLAN